MGSCAYLSYCYVDISMYISGMCLSQLLLTDLSMYISGMCLSQLLWYLFTKLYVHLRGVLECVFKCPGKILSNMASPANLTMLSRTASKFCAYICAAPTEIFFLDLKSYENTGIIGPWPECQLTPTAAAAAACQQPSLLSPPPPSSPVQEKISRSGKPLTLI